MNYKFKKKPVVIEAFQMTKERQFDNTDWPPWLHEAWNKHMETVGALYREDGLMMIQTMEGNLVVKEDNWIIQGVQGEIYPCDPVIFGQTYDPA